VWRLFLVAFVITLGAFVPSHAQINQPIYAALGPEAYGILRVLVGDRRVVAIQPGGLAGLLQQQAIETLVLPEDWGSDSDLKVARTARVAIFTVRRHNSVEAIRANIRTLSALTGTEDTGARWLRVIDVRLRHIQSQVRHYKPVRVLVLSPEGYTQGQGALITELITLANGINVAAEAGIPEAREVEDAQIRSLSPEVVLLINWSPDAALAFARNPLYRGLPAFDRHRIYRISPVGKDVARLVDDVQRLADWLHPPLF
jgi:ABC-type Fe3+-hydroxamate transport system substrate-binding protein